MFASEHVPHRKIPGRHRQKRHIHRKPEAIVFSKFDNRGDVESVCMDDQAEQAEKFYAR
jgi:hypothetical protein